MAKFLIHDWFVRQATNTKGKFLTWTTKQVLCTPEQSNEAENRERDWGETPLRQALPISLLILTKKPTVLQSNSQQPFVGRSFA